MEHYIYGGFADSSSVFHGAPVHPVARHAAWLMWGITSTFLSYVCTGIAVSKRALHDHIMGK